jgi:hypothetical protein
MPNSTSSSRSPSGSDQVEVVARSIAPAWIHEERARRREEREVQRVKRDYAKLRDEQQGRGGLLPFIRYFWHVLEPPKRDLVEGWPLEAICLHLEAITFNGINRLLINVPPGFMKSLLTDVFWPAWEWGPMNMPHTRYVAFSYSEGITTRDNNKMTRLVTSRAYRDLWGDRFDMIKLGETKIENDQTGFKLATSVGGRGTGERGDRVILDDPHNVTKVESQTEREKTSGSFANRCRTASTTTTRRLSSSCSGSTKRTSPATSSPVRPTTATS